MEKACGGIVSASAIDKTGRRAPTFKISPRERRATDKQEPRFHRKQGRVSTFGLTGNRGKACRDRREQTGREIRTAQGQGGAAPKKLFPRRVCLRARRRLNCKVRIRIRTAAAAAGSRGEPEGGSAARRRGACRRRRRVARAAAGRCALAFRAPARRARRQPSPRPPSLS